MRRLSVSLIACILLVAAILPGYSCDTSDTAVTVLSVAEGSVCVIKGGTGDCVEVQPGTVLKAGDIIRTGTDSGARITFFDGTTVDLEAGTEIALMLIAGSADTGPANIRVGQRIGSIIFRVNRIIDPGSSYDVETPTGEASVRGSVMRVDVVEDGTTLITNLQGTIWAIAQGVEVQIPEGRECIIRPEEPPELIPESEEVTFADANLEAAVREALSIPEGPIYTHDLEGLTSLTADGKGISDLGGLEYATGLTELYLWNNEISDISPLADLTGLQRLYLNTNQIVVILPLAGLTSLTHLNLAANQIDDISPLASLTGLERLYLNTNQISEISPVAGLTSLTYINIGANQIADISVLEDLIGLTELYLWMNQISDVSPLSGLTNLTRLNISANRISDISDLAGLTRLEWLHISSNEIVDISPLTGMTNLTHLNLGTNRVVDISALEYLTSLEWLYLRSNQIVDIEPLVDNAGLGEGDEVDLRNNLLNETSYTVHIPALEARGVIVHSDDY